MPFGVPHAKLGRVVANKPMVPTATPALTEPVRRSRRRHIGQPLGRRRRAALETRSSERDVRAKKPCGIEYCRDDRLLVSNSASSWSCTKAITTKADET